MNRKATTQDRSGIKTYNQPEKIKILSYRKQGEYGAKKFIKP